MLPNQSTVRSPSQSGTRTTTDLTAAQRSLFHIMRDYQFGRIENMHVAAGQPVLDHGVRLVRITRLDRDVSRPDALDGDDFQLKQPLCELFDQLMRLQDCIVVRIEFRHGLPMQLETTQDCCGAGDQSDKEAPAPARNTRSPRRPSASRES